MSKGAQEVFIYAVVAVSALFVMGYAIHMLVGGLVESDTEFKLIALVCCIAIVAMGFMTRDVIRHRRNGQPRSR